MRKVGNRIRITAQLINVENGYHLWSETYDRQLEDVFAIQDEISRAIVDALKLRLGERGRPAGGADQEHRGVHPLPEGAVRLQQVHRAGDCGRRWTSSSTSLLQDPGYARAYAGIADCWCKLADDWVVPDDAYPRAKAAATRALQHDPDLVEAITSVGQGAVLVRVGLRRRGAAAATRRGAQPQLRRGALDVRAASCPLVGRLGEAIEEMRKALVLDPLSAAYSRWLGRFLLFSGLPGRHRAGPEDDRPGRRLSLRPHSDIGSAYLALGDAETALRVVSARARGWRRASAPTTR